MKDKEFDQLFKDRFEDAEVEPSANLWNNIAKELKPRKKHVFSGYWVAAAAVLIIVSGVLLAPKEEKIRLRGEALAVIDQPQPQPQRQPLASPSPGTQVSLNEDSIVAPEIDVNTDESKPLASASTLKEVDLKKELIAMQPIVVATRPIVNLPDSIKMDKSHIDVTDLVDENLVIAKTDVSDEINDNVIEENDAPTKGIRNVGDFFNYVVSKVDKREDKFLKFNTDDDHSSLVGINIGFIRLNLKRNK